MKFSNVTQEQYDKIKIFLISNYNVTFLSGNLPAVESFEIASSGLIMGNYFDDFTMTLELKSGKSSLLEDIVEKIKNLYGLSARPELSESDEVQSILKHIMQCNVCQSKFSEIVSHLKS